MKKLIALLVIATPLLGQTVNPNQIRPSGTSGQVLETVTANQPPSWVNRLVLQHNGANVADQFLLDFNDTTPAAPSGSTQVLFQSDSFGHLSAYTIALVSGGLQNYIPDPLGTQSVVIYANSVVTNDDGSSPSAPCLVAADLQSGQILVSGGQGSLTCYNSPGPSITWSFTAASGQLPSGAVITSVYAVSTNSLSNGGWSGGAVGVQCGVGAAQTSVTAGSGGGFAMGAISAQLTSVTGANLDSTTCTAGVSGNFKPSSVTVDLNVPSVVLRAYYEGTAPPASTKLNITPCLYINTALNSMGVSAVNLARTGDCGVIGTLPMTSLTGPTQTTLTGTTAGAAIWTAPFQFSTWKFATVYLNAYENTTATAQTITLPASFATVGYVVTDGGSCAGVTISGATITLPSSMGATQTGLCEVKGY